MLLLLLLLSSSTLLQSAAAEEDKHATTRLVLTFRGGASGRQELDDFVHGVGGGEIIQVPNETVAQWVADARLLLGSSASVEVDKWYGRRVVLRFVAPPPEPIEWLGMYGMPNLESVERDMLATLSSSSSLLPQDGNFSTFNTSLVFKINATDFPTAILDGGISRSAVSTFLNVRGGYDFISDPQVALDGDGRDPDWIDPGDALAGRCSVQSWHGTQTAAMLASSTQHGLMPTTPLLPVRVLGACKTGYASDIADAIVWAAGGEIRGLSEASSSPRARIIVMPFAGFGDACPSYLQSAVSFAVARNVTLLAAAGNAGKEVQAASLFPGNCQGVLSVGAHGDGGAYAGYSSANADVYFAGGTPEHPLTCLSDGLAEVPCYGTSFSVVLATEWVVRSFLEMYPLREQRLTYAFTIPTYRARPSAGNATTSGNNLTVTGADGCDSNFFLRQKQGTICTGGSWQPCPWGSCRWGSRDLYDYYGNGIDGAWNWPRNFYMDEWCACQPGLYAPATSFVYGVPKWYCNDDATPSGKCPWAPAAHDKFSCSVCEAGWYCPGGAYFSGYAWWGNPNSNDCGDYEWSGRYWIGHRYKIQCRKCAPGTKIARDCGVGATLDRTCENCGPGTYSPQENSGSCSWCGPNTYQSGWGATGCAECPRGTWSYAGYASCTPCAAGTREENRMCVGCGSGEVSTAGSTTCTPCGPGTYAKFFEGQGPRCEPVDAGMYQDVWRGEPKACPQGTYADVRGLSACKPCAAGSVTGWARTSCTPCDTGKAPDGQQVSCISCPPGKYAPAPGTPQCLDCPTGQVAASTGQSTCTVCGEGRFAVAGASVCRNCADGNYWPSATQGTTACLRCAAGKYVLPALPPLYKPPTGCTDCKYNEVSMAGSSSCSTCEPGQFIDKTKTDEWKCASCLPGTYALNGSVTCSSCPAGSYALARASACTGCTAGKYSSGGAGAGACIDCPAGTYSAKSRATSAADCLPCVAQNFSGADGSTTCGKCGADYPAIAGHKGCATSRCLPGLVPTWAAQLAGFGVIKQLIPVFQIPYTPDGTNDVGCMRCAQTDALPYGVQMYESETPGVCKWCKVCTFGEEAEITPCTDTNNTVCLRCDKCVQGQTWMSTPCGQRTPSVCTACKPKCILANGEYESAPCTVEHDRDCKPCDTSCPSPASQYIVSDCTNTSNLQCADCEVCQPGQYAKTPCGERTARVCETCPAGKFSSAVNAASCQLCGAGTYAPEAGATYCERCAVGNYASSSGATACLGCGVGSYAVKEGVSSCTSCAAGTFLLSAVTGTCQSCAAGTYSTTEGATTCARCLPGTFANATGLTACRACAAGTYASQSNSSSCTACPAGSYSGQPGQSACALCAPGTYSAAPGTSACTLCAGGQYIDEAGQTQCKTCYYGTYAPPGSASCIPCADGTFGGQEGLSACTTCTPPCEVGKTYEEHACKGYYDRICSSCDVQKSRCNMGFTSNVSWCPPDRNGGYNCVPCPVYGSENVDALPEYSCLTCTSRHCGETPGTYRPRMCPADKEYYSNYDTFSCGTCRGCYYRHYVKTWSFCSGLGSQLFDLDPDSSEYCAPCLTECKVGQYIANLCNGRTTHNTETCVDCKSCPFGYYHARSLNGSMHPDFAGKPWSKGYTEVRFPRRPAHFCRCTL